MHDSLVIGFRWAHTPVQACRTHASGLGTHVLCARVPVHTDCLTSGLKTDVHTSTSTHTLACMFIGGANIPNM